MSESESYHSDRKDTGDISSEEEDECEEEIDAKEDEEDEEIAGAEGALNECIAKEEPDSAS